MAGVVLLVPVRLAREMSMGKWSGAERTAYQLQREDRTPLGVGLFDTEDAAGRWARGRRMAVRKPKP